MEYPMADVTVKINDNGPYEIIGPIQLKDADGNEFSVEGDQYLCRCGNSGTKPFCDGSHRRAGFQDQARAGVTRHCPALRTPLEEYLCRT